MNILDSLKKYFYKNGSSEASSDARIPLLTATGEPKGSDTMANIASVLGGVQQLSLLTNGYDIDELDYTSCCIVGSSNISPHKPSGQTNGSLLTVVTGGGRRVQLWVSETTVFVRQYDNNYSGGWYNWQRVDNFGCNTPSDLASLLGVRVTHVLLADANTDNNSFMCSGYNVGETQNIPEEVTRWGYFVQIPGNGNDVVQYITPFDAKEIYMRYRDGASNYTNWNRITNSYLNQYSDLSSLANALGVPKNYNDAYGPAFMTVGGDGLYLFGGYSTDLTEFSCYIGTYRQGVLSPTSYCYRLDSGNACVIDSNSGGTLAINNPTAGKDYKYYFVKIGSI